MFIREYLRFFVPLAVLFAVYRAFAVPFIEAPATALVPIGPSAVQDRSVAWWSDYFKPGSWQLDQPMMAETAQGTILLFGKLERLSSDRLKLSPLTILIPQRDETSGKIAGAPGSNRKAIVIENPQGTEIQFRSAMDFLGGQLPPVKGGQMIGEIKIFAPPKEGDMQDGMLIETRELRIDRRHIWTTGAVKMKLGQSYIDGRDLSIYLEQDLLSSKAASSDLPESPLNGLDNLDLVYVDRVHINLPDNGLFAEKTTDTASVNPPRKAHAEVHCDGAFHFDFHDSLASLSSKVKLLHIVDGLKPDIFQSDRLDLHFRWLPSNPKAKDQSAANQVTSNEWSVDRIEAYGSNSMDPNDPARWVRLEAPNLNARGEGRWLKVELDRGKISLANHFPGVIPNDSSQVYLQRDSLEVRSPEIEYESHRLVTSAPQARTSDTEGVDQRLGTLWAAGPGRATVVSEDGDPWRLSWAKSLQLKPDGPSDRLTIDGTANAISDLKGRFSADTVDLWLKGVPENVISQVASQHPGYEPSSVLPERMHAAGQVRIETAQLRASVTDMQVWFDYPEIQAAKIQLSAKQRDQSRKMDPNLIVLENDRPERQFTTRPTGRDGTNGIASSPNQPGATSSQASPLGTAFSSLATIANGASTNSTPASTTSPMTSSRPGQLAVSNMTLPGFSSKLNNGAGAVPDSPLNVTGETLVAKLSQSSQGMTIDDLALSGSIVTVTRNSASTASPLPLTITGSQLRMNSADQGKLYATIVGSPAKFAVGTGAVESSEINFSELRQMVWIDQPGHFRIPPEAMQSIATAPKKNTSNVSAGNVLTAPGFIPNNNPANDSVKWIEPPEIRWQGRMAFDGRKVSMDGGVKLSGRVQTDPETVWHLAGSSSEMLVELQEPVVIGSKTNSPLKIANIQLKDKNSVDIKSAQTDLKGVRRQLDHLEVPELTIYVPEQKWVGTGPGSLRSRRLGNANPISPQSIKNGRVEATPSMQTRNPVAELQCLHLRFRGKMEGNMNQQMVTFSDRVETLLEPIFSWDQAPDVELVDRLRMGQTTLMCDQLSVYNTAKLSFNETQIANEQLRRDAAWEVAATGHVVVESVNEKGSIAATEIERAQYVAIHSLLRIEGSPGRPAIIEETSLSNAVDRSPTPNRFAIPSMAMNLKTGETDVQISSVLIDLSGRQNGGNPGNTNQQPAGLNGLPNRTPGGGTLPSARPANPFGRP